MRILWDENNLYGGVTAIDPCSVLSPSSLKLLRNFIKRVDGESFGYCKEVEFNSANGAAFFSLFGVSKPDEVYLFAILKQEHAEFVYDEFMKLMNEQGRMLRLYQQEGQRLSKARENESSILESYMQLNNDMAKMQRELALKNNLLAAQEKRLRDIISFNPDAQIVLSRSNSVLFATPPANALLSSNPQELREILEEAETGACKEFYVDTGNQRVYLEVRCTDIQWEQTPAKLILLQDISERKKVEQVKDDVQRITQHDLISPLNAIIGIPTVLADDDNLDSEQKEMLGAVAQAGQRMVAMIRLSLDLYKMEEGTYKLVSEPVDLLSIFDEIRSDFSAQLLKGASLVVATEAGLMQGGKVLVSADSNLVYSLFSNLINNALEASKFEAPVSVRIF